MDDATSDAQRGTIWEHKPWWCQPWSILLTGIAAVALSWLWLHRWWITGPVSAAVLVWWTLFLFLVPRAWTTAMQSEKIEP
jgi:hypothetical protein